MRRGGFTLLELLIVMTLLSLLLVALFGGLRFAGRNGDRAEAVVAETERLDIARDLLTRRLEAMLPLTGGTGGKLLFTGKRDRLAFPIARPPNPEGGGLILASFIIETKPDGRHLIYREYRFKPGAAIEVEEQPIRSSSLLIAAGDLHFRYNGGTDWADAWPEGSVPPRLVSLTGLDGPSFQARPRALPAAP